tara:strand:- start:645 stop:905 length:261 start_codon:yes stop_codon:yes gene_type:complete
MMNINVASKSTVGGACANQINVRHTQAGYFGAVVGSDESDRLHVRWMTWQDGTPREPRNFKTCWIKSASVTIVSDADVESGVRFHW